jgi:hypothetical protein
MSTDNKKTDIEKCKDSGLALVLICLVCYLFWPQQILIFAAIIFLLIAMSYPPILKPFAIFWFAFSSTLGNIVSKTILTLLFFALVLPVGLIRHFLRKDSMQINRWKKGNESVFRLRNHGFTAEDLKHPY